MSNGPFRGQTQLNCKVDQTKWHNFEWKIQTSNTVITETDPIESTVKLTKLSDTTLNGKFKQVILLLLKQMTKSIKLPSGDIYIKKLINKYKTSFH
ncbi:hypothetical protein G9A89_002976 [Geosiphon pyriformis]|nr:hypothetical protein G9A89_002976 [Geosiphon pyriformis]